MRESQVETQVLLKILIQKEKKFFLSIEIYATFLEMRADRAVRGERERGFLKNKKDYLLSEVNRSWASKN